MTRAATRSPTPPSVAQKTPAPPAVMTKPARTTPWPPVTSASSRRRMPGSAGPVTPVTTPAARHSAQPACDGDGLACRGCLSNAECQGVDGAWGAMRRRELSTVNLHARRVRRRRPRPVCAANFTCVACAEDATCIAQLGDRDECVGGRCQLCDNRNGQATRDDDLANPVCQNNNACGPCQNDAQCRRGGDAPPNLECFNGLCVECDPGTGQRCGS